MYRKQLSPHRRIRHSRSFGVTGHEQPHSSVNSPLEGIAGGSQEMKQTYLFSGLCVASLFGCADVRVPEYQRPDTPAKSNWSRPSATTVSAAEAISPTWWQQFGDPYLNSLVAKAVTGNFDLRGLQTWKWRPPNSGTCAWRKSPYPPN